MLRKFFWFQVNDTGIEMGISFTNAGGNGNSLLTLQGNGNKVVGKGGSGIKSNSLAPL